ncbi:MAG TPA: hypothetical protein DGG95_14595 [Cytophagales bacterium]|nr:hypothetical protein [Cytophagales bacterium]
MIVLAVQFLFSFVLLNLFFNQLMTEPKFDLRFYTIVFAIAIAFTVFPLFLNLYALNRINAATIGILMYINPLMNFAIAFLIIHESANTIQVIGYGIIGVALVIFNYPILARISKQE